MASNAETAIDSLPAVRQPATHQETSLSTDKKIYGNLSSFKESDQVFHRMVHVSRCCPLGIPFSRVSLVVSLRGSYS